MTHNRPKRPWTIPPQTAPKPKSVSTDKNGYNRPKLGRRPVNVSTGCPRVDTLFGLRGHTHPKPPKFVTNRRRHTLVVYVDTPAPWASKTATHPTPPKGGGLTEPPQPTNPEDPKPL